MSEDPTRRSAPSTVVVGLAGTPGSDAALRWAVDYAGRIGADVHAIAVWQTRSRFADPAIPAIRGTTVKSRLPSDVRAAARRNGVGLRGTVIAGDPADVLLRSSREADVLVLGKPRRGLFLGGLFGSVAQRCCRHARCPVVLVPAPATGR